ncbi:MAG: hypothetical protein QE280_14235 [Caulobacter sp.]|nr:hypothetical protein [Caulobacter sp.]
MKRLVAISLALCLAAAGAVQAHRGRSSLSVVEIDGRTGAILATHRFAAHDVEPVLTILAPDAQPSLDDPAALEAFRAHVGRNFKVDGSTLVFRSQRLKGDGVDLVFSGQTRVPVSQVTVSADILPQIFSDEPAEMQVNIRVGGQTRSLLFLGGQDQQTVRFD